MTFFLSLPRENKILSPPEIIKDLLHFEINRVFLKSKFRFIILIISGGLKILFSQVGLKKMHHTPRRILRKPDLNHSDNIYS
jgi:hypothetical protein